MKAGDEAALAVLKDGAGLTDSCEALACGDELRIDRVLYRSSAALEVWATEWRLDESFVDGEGAPLSDHEAVAVAIAWRAPRG